MKYKHLLKYFLSVPQEKLEDDVTIKIGEKFIPVFAVAEHDGDELDEGHIVLVALDETNHETE